MARKRVKESGPSLLLVALIAAQAAAYEHPLNSSAIWNAYFLGSSNSESVNFLSKYKETLPPPKTGPYIAEMEVRTPFAQVVVSSREHSVGYSPMQAGQDYKKDPDTVQARIQIRFTTTFALLPPQPPPACQGVQRMNSAKDCIYSGGDSSVLIGGDVWFTLRGAEVASAPLRVTVSTPDGHEVSATFDLAALR